MVDVDHAGKPQLVASTRLGLDIALDEIDEVGVQGLGFLGPDGPLLPIVGLLPEEASGFGIVVQEEPVNEVNPQNLC